MDNAATKDANVKIEKFFLKDFWWFSFVVGILTVFSGLSLFWFKVPEVLFRAFCTLFVGWAVINLALVPGFTKARVPLSLNLITILCAALFFPLAMFETSVMPGRQLFGPLFNSYVLCSGLFLSYAGLKLIRALENSRSPIDVSGWKLSFFHGTKILDWLWRLVFLLTMVQLLSSDEFFFYPQKAGDKYNMAGLISPLSPPLLLSSLLLIWGMLKRFRSLIIIGGTTNLIFSFYIFSQIKAESPEILTSVFALIGRSGWVLLGGSVFYIISSAATFFFKANGKEIDSKPFVMNEKFELKKREALPFLAFAAILLLFFVKLTNPEQELSAAVEKNNLVRFEEILSESPELLNNEQFFRLVDRGKFEALKLFIARSGDKKFKLSEDRIPFYLLDDSCFEMLKFLDSQGQDFSHHRYVRAALTRYGSCTSKSGFLGFAVLDFLFSIRKNKGLALDEFYQPDEAVNDYISKGFTNPLATALAMGKAELARYLFNKGFRIDDEVVAASLIGIDLSNNPVVTSLKVSGDGHLKKPLAFYLIEGKQSETNLRYFLELGIDLTELDSEGNNVLHWAAQFYSLDNKAWLLKKAIEKGVDLNRENSQGYTPLFFSAVSNRLESFLLLLELGANFKISDSQGQTLKEFCEKNGREMMLGYLNER